MERGGLSMEQLVDIAGMDTQSRRRRQKDKRSVETQSSGAVEGLTGLGCRIGGGTCGAGGIGLIGCEREVNVERGSNATRRVVCGIETGT